MVSIPKVPVILIGVIVLFAIFQITDAFQCFECKDKAGKNCAGGDWKKQVLSKDKRPIKNCNTSQIFCVAVFNKDAKATFRGCMEPSMESLFRNKVCIEKSDDVKEVYKDFDGVNACACEKDLCNPGLGGASGIEFKIAMILGTPLILLGIHFFY